MIALEPEAASIYIRQLRMSQLVPQHPVSRRSLFSSPSRGGGAAPHESPNSTLNSSADTAAAAGSGANERVSESFVPGS